MNPPNPVLPPPPERPIKSPGLTLTIIAITLSGLGVVLVFGGALTWFSGFFPECKNDNLRIMASPDGKMEAILFRRDCGDPSSFTTHVSIVKTGEDLPNKTGNAFTASGEAPVILRWQDDRNLVIEADGETNVTYRATHLGDVKVTER